MLNSRSFLIFGRSLVTLFCTTLVFTSTANGQSHIKPIQCGNEIFNDILANHYPDLLRQFNQTFEDARHNTRDLRDDPYTIKVVVHVVWNEDAENLDDSIVLDQLRILNEDFNRTNADSANLRELFQPVAGAANIHFELESIVRVHTDEVFSVDILGNNLIPEVKHDATGGSEAWDPNEYLNLWVCKIQPIVIFGLEVGQLLGFSFPPNNLPNWPQDVGAPTPDEDGVVIDYRVFGSNNPNTILNPGTTDLLAVQGRTPVHEVGHYLGLRHIWGDGGLLGPNDCAQSDGIEDTPYANAQSNFDCDITKNTCTAIEPFYNADVPDLVENFMDYASETCMNMFSKGQVNLMRSVLEGPRKELISDISEVEDVWSENNLVLFPNPNAGTFQIRLADSKLINAKVRVLDLSGILILEQTLEDDNHTIDVSYLINGLYVVEVINGTAHDVSKMTINRN